MIPNFKREISSSRIGLAILPTLGYFQILSNLGHIIFILSPTSGHLFQGMVFLQLLTTLVVFYTSSHKVPQTLTYVSWPSSYYCTWTLHTTNSSPNHFHMPIRLLSADLLVSSSLFQSRYLIKDEKWNCTRDWSFWTHVNSARILQWNKVLDPRQWCKVCLGALE